MAEQLHSMTLTNEDLRKQRHELISSKFSMQIIAQEHINLYQNLLNQQN
jgi:beta-lactamase class D